MTSFARGRARRKRSLEKRPGVAKAPLQTKSLLVLSTGLIPVLCQDSDEPIRTRYQRVTHSRRET